MEFSVEFKVCWLLFAVVCTYVFMTYVVGAPGYIGGGVGVVALVVEGIDIYREWREERRIVEDSTPNVSA